MLTRKMLTRTTGLAALMVAATLLAEPATASEELVVYGRDTSDLLAANEAALRLAMKEHVHALNQNLREALDKDVKRVMAPSLQLAVLDSVGRG